MKLLISLVKFIALNSQKILIIVMLELVDDYVKFYVNNKFEKLSK